MIGFPLFISAENNSTDQDEIVFFNAISNDSIGIRKLLDRSEQYARLHPELSLKYSAKANDFAIANNDSLSIARALNLMSENYATHGNYDKALSCVRQSINVNEQIKNTKGLLENYSQLSTIYHYKGNVLKAIVYSEMRLSISQELNDSLAICNALAILGIDLYEAGKYKLALEYEMQALSLAEQLKDKKAISLAMNNFGVVYETQGNLSKALEYYQQSYLIDIEQNDQYGASIAASNITSILKQQGQYHEALVFCEKGLSHAKEIGFIMGQNYNYENMGLIYSAMGAYDKAIESHLKTLELQEQTGNMKGVAVCKRDLANIYILQEKLSEAKKLFYESLEISETIACKTIEASSYIGLSQIAFLQSNFKKAYEFSTKANIMVMEMGHAELIKQSAELLAKSSKELGLFKKSLEAFELFKTMSDSLNSTASIRSIANLEYEYKYNQEKKLLLIEQQKSDQLQAVELQKQKNVRNTFVFAFILMIAFSALIYKEWSLKRKANLLLKAKNKEINSQSEELKTINDSLIRLSLFKEDMTNMLVHDLKNPIAAILNFEVVADEIKRKNIVKQSGFTMMNLVQNMLDVYKYQTESIIANKKNLNLDNIIQEAVQEVQFLMDLKNIKLIVEPVFVQLDTDSDLLRRIFSNILTNATKYSPTDGCITIDTEVDEQNKLMVSIHNDGPYIPEEDQPYIFEKFGQLGGREVGRLKSTGLGLTFCKMAVEALGGTIHVKSQSPIGATFYFILPTAKIVGI